MINPVCWKERDEVDVFNSIIEVYTHRTLARHLDRRVSNEQWSWRSCLYECSTPFVEKNGANGWNKTKRNAWKKSFFWRLQKARNRACRGLPVKKEAVDVFIADDTKSSFDWYERVSDITCFSSFRWKGIYRNVCVLPNNLDVIVDDRDGSVTFFAVKGRIDFTGRILFVSKVEPANRMKKSLI